MCLSEQILSESRANPRKRDQDKIDEQTSRRTKWLKLGDRTSGSAMEGVGENWTRRFPVFEPPQRTVKTRKLPVRECRKYTDSWGFGDVVMDRVRTTLVPAKGNERKKKRVRFLTGPLTDPFWPELTDILQCTNRTSRITLPHFIFQELPSVIITPPMTPWNMYEICLGELISVISWKNCTTWSWPCSKPAITPKYSQRIDWRNEFRLGHTRKFLGSELCNPRGPNGKQQFRSISQQGVEDLRAAHPRKCPRAHDSLKQSS